MRDLLLRALLVWLGLLAFTNGPFREFVLVRLFSPAAAEAFSALLIALLIILSLVAVRPLDAAPPPVRVWFSIGLLWSGLTAAFQFLLGALGRSCLLTTIRGTRISVSPSCSRR